MVGLILNCYLYICNKNSPWSLRREKNTIKSTQQHYNKIKQNLNTEGCKNHVHGALKTFFYQEKFGVEHVAIAFYVLLAGLGISGIGNTLRIHVFNKISGK